MGTLRYAMLGLIQRAPATGYDISKAFSGRLGSIWGARHSQIYPELKKLMEEGLVNCTVISELQEKKLYSITEAGKEAFRTWLLSDEDEYRPPKDTLRLKLYFCETLEPEEYLSVLLRAREQHIRRVEWMRAHCSEVYPETPCQFSPALGDFMLMRGGILREQAYVDWMDHCIAHVRRIMEPEKEKNETADGK